MKYYSRLRVHKNSTGSNVVDVYNVKAVSYNWWTYATTYKGTNIFNNYSYSVSTSKHQSDAWRVFDAHGVRFSFTLYLTNNSLSNIITALNSEIRCAVYEIEQLEKAIAKPRSHKAKNGKRRIEITELKDHALSIKNLLGEDIYKEVDELILDKVSTVYNSMAMVS